MELIESQDLKPFYAQLKRIQIGKFLVSKEFRLLTIEWRIDANWELIWKEVRSLKRNIISREIDLESPEKAFYILISTLYLKDKHHQLEDLLFKVLNALIINSNTQIDLSGVFKELSNTDFELMSLANIRKLKILNAKSNNKKSNLDPISQITIKNNSTPLSKNIFIVHGHNELLKETVARTLQTLGLTPIILHEQANSGKTIIEKMEKHSDVGFAVV